MSDIPMATVLTILYADGKIGDVTAMLREVPDEAELSGPLGRILNGPFKHVVVRPADEDYRDMFIRESSEGMERNEAATRMYRNMLMAGTTRTDPESLPVIYGTAVLANRKLRVG